MFKNPLKYQQGGKTQDPIGQLVKWLVQNTGLDENQISQRLEQILSDDTAKQKLVNNLQNMQKGDQNAAKNIIGMFVPQSAKFGGKIRDFICKHARGGKVDCGCKQEGGEIENKKPGYNVREERYPNGQLAGRDEYANGMIRGSLNPDTDDEWRWMGEEGSPFAIEPQSQRSRGPIIGTKYVNQNYWNWLNNQMDIARKYGTLDYKENGGKVEKHQDANGKIGVTKGQYQASDWENEFNQFTPTPGGGYARNYRLPMFGGHRWGIPGNTLRQVLITYGDNGIPRKAVRDLEGYYGNGQIDTVIYDAYGNKHNSPEFEARVNRELEGMDPHQRPFQKENGGKVEKAQDGNNIEYSKDNIHYYKRKKDTEVIDTPDASVVLQKYPSSSVPEKLDSAFFVYPSNGEQNLISRKWKQSFVPSEYRPDIWSEDNRWRRIDVAGPSTFNQMRDWWNYYKSKSKK